jgi:hypothetical protein
MFLLAGFVAALCSDPGIEFWYGNEYVRTLNRAWVGSSEQFGADILQLKGSFVAPDTAEYEFALWSADYFWFSETHFWFDDIRQFSANDIYFGAWFASPGTLTKDFRYKILQKTIGQHYYCRMSIGFGRSSAVAPIYPEDAISETFLRVCHESGCADPSLNRAPHSCKPGPAPSRPFRPTIRPSTSNDFPGSGRISRSQPAKDSVETLENPSVEMAETAFDNPFSIVTPEISLSLVGPGDLQMNGSGKPEALGGEKSRSLILGISIGLTGAVLLGIVVVLTVLKRCGAKPLPRETRREPGFECATSLSLWMDSPLTLTVDDDLSRGIFCESDSPST